MPLGIAIALLLVTPKMRVVVDAEFVEELLIVAELL
jgi:hypothetical protein